VKKLRLGIFVDSANIEGWQRFALQKILADDHFDVVIAIENRAANASDQRRSGGVNLWPVINAFEERLSEYLYKRVFKHKLSQKDQPGDLRSMAKDANWLTISKLERPRNAALGETLEISVKDVARIAASDLDVLINLGKVPLKGAVLNTARHGVWEFRYGQNDPDSSVTPGFWEIYNNEPVCRVDLIKQTDAQSQPEIIKTGIYRTFYWSWNENARKLKYRSSWLLIDSLKALAKFDGKNYQSTSYRESLPAQSHLRGEPSALQSLATVSSYFTRLAWEKARRYFYNDKWSIFVQEGTSANAAWSSSQKIEPPDECYWADPFLIKRNGRHYIFFEEYGFAEKKGFISYIELPNPLEQNQLENIRSKPVINNDYHMSYPFLLEHEGELYMIPESSENHTISLWKCDQFPDIWSKQKDLIEGISAVDSTLVNWNNKWWMFTNVDRTGAGEHYTELNIYHTDDPINGNWLPHPQNPVVTDVTRARMAGNFIKLPDGRLIRCNQVIKTYYGEAIGMQEVVKLSETEYEEKPHNKIEANWRKDIYRNHHTDSRDGLAVIDACRHVFKLKLPLFRS